MWSIRGNLKLIYFVTFFLLVESIVDIKRKSVMFCPLVIMAVIITIGNLYAKNMHFIDMIYGVLPALVLFLAGKFTGFIGEGDILIIMLIGLLLGFTKTVIAISYAFTLAAIISGLMLVFKKIKIKQSIPMIPFLFLGFLGVAFV